MRKQIDEKLLLKNWDEYLKLVAEAYESADDYDSGAAKHWKSLNNSNHKMWKRLLSKVDIVFVTEEKSKVGKITIQGKTYPIIYLEGGQPYTTQPEMLSDYKETGKLKINIDYSDHPIFSVEDNVIMRTVHDFIVHILGNHGFGGKGEIASYNLHVKLAPKDAVPALFTEVVGQAAYAIVKGGFPKQKIAVLEGFDFYNLGAIDSDNYVIKDKLLVKKDDIDNIEKYDKGYQSDLDFKAIEGKHKEEPELELSHVKRKLNRIISLF